MHRTGSRRWPALFLLLACVCAPRGAEAQSVVRGEVRGTVSTEDGSPISEALVTATDALTNASRWVESRRDGSFEISALPPGTYEVRIEALGYRPLLHRSVSVRPGQAARLRVRLVPASPPVEVVDTAVAGGAGTARFFRTGGHRLAQGELDAFPDLQRSLAELAARSSEWDGSLGTQGLPGRLTTVYLDGIPATPARHPMRDAGSLQHLGAPRAGLRDLHLMDVPVDVEWAGAAGGYVAAGTRGARNRPAGSLYGTGSFDALWFGDGFSSSSTPSAISGWGAVTRDLPLAGDSSRVFVAVEGRNVETPRSPPLTGPLSSALTAEGTSVPAGVADPWAQYTRSISGITRLDWNLSPETDVLARVSVGHLEGGGGRFFGAPEHYGFAPSFLGTDVIGATSIISRVTSQLTLELRAGFARSERSYGSLAGSDLDASVPPTRLVQPRATLGDAAGLDGQVTRSALTGTSAVRAELGEHGVKLGIDLTLPSYEYEYAFRSDGEFFFSDVPSLEAREGGYVGLSSPVLPTSFSVPEVGAFLQYTWEPQPEFRLTSGVRWAWEFLPDDDVAPNRRWEELTGLRNASLPGDLSKFGARIGISWDLTGEGSTFIQGAFAADHDRLDPAALHEIISLSGAVRGRRVLGDLGSWPDPPSGSAPTHEGTLLALPGPKIEAPRTTRATISFQQVLDTGTSLRVSGTFRRTDFLLRRRDLNLTVAPATESQNGRPVYGELTKLGGLVRPTPGSDRRFSEFDAVWALSADGWSEYVGAGVAVEHGTPRADLFASYTYSQTEDNWIGAGAASPEAGLDPGLDDALNRDWQVGTSDFDLPHRVVAGARAELGILEGVDLAVLYRFHSGRPFTPTYPAGVDVNGDGSGRNDPAFVPDLPEIRDLGGTWSCLTSSIGRIAPRNACKAPDVHTLDARVAALLFRVGTAPVRIVVEGLNLLDAEVGPRDDALLIVDEAVDLATDSETGAITIPVRVNPSFGEPLRVLGSGRRIRLGFSVGGP